MKKVCMQCGKTLKRKRYTSGALERATFFSSRIFCGNQCSGKSKRGKVKKRYCKYCRRSLTLKSYKDGTIERARDYRKRKYCDKSCTIKHNNKKARGFNLNDKAIKYRFCRITSEKKYRYNYMTVRHKSLARSIVSFYGGWAQFLETMGRKTAVNYDYPEYRRIAKMWISFQRHHHDLEIGDVIRFPATWDIGLENQSNGTTYRALRYLEKTGAIKCLEKAKPGQKKASKYVLLKNRI